MTAPFVRGLGRRATSLAGAVLALASLLAFSVGPAAGQSTTPLRVATTPIDIGAQPFYAEDEGFFKNNGLDVKTEIISNGAAIVSAVMGGSVDIAQSNLVSLAAAHERGLPLVVIAAAGLYSSKDPTSALVVTKSSPIKTAKDMNGKTFAGNGVRNISQIGPDAWIAKNGGDPSTTKFVEMPFPEMGAALDAGRVDAALIAEPELSATLAKNARVLGYAYDGIAPTFLIGAWFTTASWAKAHPDLVKRFQKAMAESAAWANKNRPKSAEVLQKHTKIDVTPGMKRATYGEKLDPALIQPLVDASAKFGAIKATFPASELIAAEAR